MLTVGSLFSGIGGFDLGLERAGCKIIWQCENDPFARSVLQCRWPHVTCATDVREWASDGNESIDLLCGGFPCQDLSIAGKREGLAGARSGLFHEFIRIAKALAPIWGLVENVPGLFSSHGGRDMATVLEGLRQCWPVVGYRVLDSRYWGVAQRRRRIFFVGGPSAECVEQVLFESQGSGGHLAPSHEAGPHLAASLRSRSHGLGVNPPGRGGEDDMNLVCVPAIQFSGPPGSRRDDEASLVIAETLTGHHPRYNPTDCMIPIQYPEQHRRDMRNNGVGLGENGDPSFTLDGSYQHGIGSAFGVRRLTPTECERLQGFPDGWTCLCQPLETYDSNQCKCPDGPRYKTLGNAVTVPVIEWLGRRIVEALP
jgi:DNA (cytosine-5)-methyltransferase 1